MSVAWLDDDVLFIDGESQERIPRGKQWEGRDLYLLKGGIGALVTSYACDSDTLSGSTPGQPSTLDCRPGGGPRFLLGDAWGLPSDFAKALEKLEDLREACRVAGLPWKATAGGLAAHIVRKHCAERHYSHAIRDAIRDAITPGPMVACRGSLDHAVQWDKSAAFLGAIGYELPDDAVPACVRWSRLRDATGVVTATVESFDGSAIGAVWARTDGVTHWPTGYVTGTWPIAHLRAMEDANRGEVLAVHDGIRFGLAASGLRHAIDALPDVLRKLVYTRAWGVMSSRSSWTGHPSKRIAREGIGVPLRHIAWEEWSTADRATFRPDVAMSITSGSTIGVCQLLWRIPPLDVALVHVDAIWHRNSGGWTIPDGWKEKGCGPMRVYAIGTYEHAGRIAAQGVPSWETANAREIIARMERGAPRGTLESRAWTDGKTPAHAPDALSMPHHYDTADRCVLIERTPTWATGGAEPWVIEQRRMRTDGGVDRRRVSDAPPGGLDI